MTVAVMSLEEIENVSLRGIICVGSVGTIWS